MHSLWLNLAYSSSTVHTDACRTPSTGHIAVEPASLPAATLLTAGTMFITIGAAAQGFLVGQDEVLTTKGIMPASPLTPIDPRVEMFQRGQPRDNLFNMKALAPRPMSNATEMFDTDFEDDESEIESEIEEDNSPRLSLNSAGRRSETTLSSFEEVHTPGPFNEFQGFQFELDKKPPVEGPKGPHLFRSSVDSMVDGQDDMVLGMSPLTPRATAPPNAYNIPPVPPVPQIPARHRPLSSLTDAVESLDLREVARWTPRQVARWMYDAGFEPSIVEKFEENDISGEILITLKFEDLRELDIPSFGQRTKVWNEIHVLRGSAPSTPKPPTPFEEVVSPCIEYRHDSRSHSRDSASDEETARPRRHKSKSKKRNKKFDDIISPLESVSIVGIEQLIPKPHKCSKGENCSKWRRQQRLIKAFKDEHPVSPEGGMIFVAGDPGNPLTAPSQRPFSDAVPSVVASSDVLGPSQVPEITQPNEENLRNVASRDPQDNVKQFLQFQHLEVPQQGWTPEQPPSPPYEMFPPLPAPHSGLRGLPKLAIPPPRPAPPPRAASANGFIPYRMDRAEAVSPDLRNAPDFRNATASPSTVYRFGTPFSEMDVPVTAINLGPVARDTSQSVPPNMSYRHAPAAPLMRTQSRSSRRPSYQQGMPRVDEDKPLVAPTRPPRSPKSSQPFHSATSSSSSLTERSSDDITYQGWMKKRKTKMLRHEWHEHHFTLKGTRLAMRKDERALESLEYIDVDDYAIACSSLASGSKLNAAFKAMNISRGKNDKKDEAAFAFQLIPAPTDKGVKLRKRESTMSGTSTAISGESAKNKTHYFAVRSRDERIDWMRELMLAKALKQKSDGYEVTVNGNMI
ncbi:hypothetical protein B7463_g11061, partial [Scytalidium lignicola]